jgi:hypothetical protein
MRKRETQTPPVNSNHVCHYLVVMRHQRLSGGSTSHCGSGTGTVCWSLCDPSKDLFMISAGTAVSNSWQR